jgi:WhiB family redox-sensing transcriptional regulator
MFFDEDREDAALAVCGGCPARAECLAYALDSEEFGVWGGTTPGQRDALRGGSLEGTPEDRQLVWLINERVNRGDLMPDIAEAVGVNQRTLYRWLAEGREEAA